MKAVVSALCLVLGPWLVLLALWWPKARAEMAELVRREEDGD